ncbi:MAG: hypothetical protein ACRDGA_13925 [Bacteroidota bacterium]
MNIILDIVGSLAIRGAIVLVVLQLNVSLHQTLYLKTATANVRGNLATMVSIIEADVRQAGYGVTGTTFLTIDSDDVEFLADLNNDGTVDTLRYYLNGTSVYRTVTGSATPVCIGVGLTQFKFEYIDVTGIATASPETVRSVKFLAAMETNYEIKQTSDGESYRPSATVEHQFFPQNL